MVSNITAGLGVNFEKFNAAWLKHILQQRGIETPKITINHKEMDLYNEGW